MTGGEITEEEHEVILHAERPVVATEAVPVERVRLGTETATEQRNVTGEVRKEQIEVKPESVDRQGVDLDRGEGDFQSGLIGRRRAGVAGLSSFSTVGSW